MAAQRKRRTSKLSSSHPAAPAAPESSSPAEAAPQPAAETAPKAATSTTEADKPATGSAEETPAKKQWRHKVSIYQDRDLTDRMRGAILHTIPHEGPRSISDFINGLVEKELRRLETEYNNGEEFPRVSAKGFPQGRPMGS